MTQQFSHDPTFITKLKSIEQLINDGKLKDAADQLNLLGRTSSHDPRLFLLGSALAQAAGNPAGALQAARKAHQLAPTWPIATIRLAKTLDDQKEAVEAVKMAEAAVEQASQQAGLDVALLSNASAIAQHQNQLPLALKWLDQAEKMSPGDLIIRLQAARAFDAANNYAEAVDRYTSLLDKLPKNGDLLYSRMHVFFRSKQMEKAADDAQALVDLDPTSEKNRFFLAVARGENPGNQPSEVVSTLFDGYADRFDQHLVVTLQYRLPKDVAEMIHQWHPDRKGDVLDLGCGTGLLGVCLGRLEGVLVGVDLSNEMIEKAAQHNVYDKFHLVDVVAAVKATPANQYHVVAALEVFVYIGDLQEVVPNALRILMPGGRFIFSCEAAQDGEKDFNLQETFRYTHQPGYLQKLMDEAGFEDVTIEERSVRMHAGQPVSGLLVTGRKPVSV